MIVVRVAVAADDVPTEGLSMKDLSRKSLLAVTILSLLINIAFCIKVHALRLEVERSQSLVAGVRLPAMTMLDDKNNPVTIRFDNQKQSSVVYVFTPKCGWCAKNLPDFEKLYGFRQHDYRFIVVSLSGDGLAEYLQSSGLKMHVYSKPLQSDQDLYHLGSTPQTIVIGPDGVVQKSWEGAYQDNIFTEVQDYFKLNSGDITPAI